MGRETGEGKAHKRSTASLVTTGQSAEARWERIWSSGPQRMASRNSGPHPPFLSGALPRAALGKAEVFIFRQRQNGSLCPERALNKMSQFESFSDEPPSGEPPRIRGWQWRAAIPASGGNPSGVCGSRAWILHPLLEMPDGAIRPPSLHLGRKCFAAGGGGRSQGAVTGVGCAVMGDRDLSGQRGTPQDSVDCWRENPAEAAHREIPCGPRAQTCLCPGSSSWFQPCRSQRQWWQKTAGSVAERAFENENEHEHLFRENEDKSLEGGEEKAAWLALGVLSSGPESSRPLQIQQDSPP